VSDECLSEYHVLTYVARALHAKSALDALATP
jgi:hypothetical protein